MYRQRVSGIPPLYELVAPNLRIHWPLLSGYSFPLACLGMLCKTSFIDDSPSSWCGSADHAANVDVREGLIAAYPELIAIGMSF
jgi:hypothetical protein